MTKGVLGVPGKVSQAAINGGVLRVVDGNRSNTKLTNKNNIINGTNNSNNQLNSNYSTNLATQQQFTGSLQELNNNVGGGKQQQQQPNNTSLAALFDQFTEVVTLDEIEDQNENLNSSKKTAVQLNLACDFASKDQKAKWEAILYDNNLYLQIPAGVLFETSKEAFVNLLEYAEEELKCQNVVICLDKNCVEKCKYDRHFADHLDQSLSPFLDQSWSSTSSLSMANRILFLPRPSTAKNLIRMFMYFGFYALSPSHSLTPENASDSLLFMAYSF